MKKIFFLFFASFLLLSFFPALAADSGCSGFESQFSFLSGDSGANPAAGLPKVCTAGSAIGWITNLALSFAGVIAVVFIIVGGYMYLTSAGNEEAAEKGRKVLTNAIIGLIIIILSAAIVRIVVNTLDSGTSLTPNVTSNITYPTGSSTPPGGGNGEMTPQDLGTLKDAFSVGTTQTSFSLSQSSSDLIKQACSIQNIGSNVAVSAKVGATEIGRSALTLQGGSYVGSFSYPAGAFSSTDTVYVYVCGRLIAPFGP